MDAEIVGVVDELAWLVLTNEVEAIAGRYKGVSCKVVYRANLLFAD
jgi:hypothetical protein